MAESDRPKTPSTIRKLPQIASCNSLNISSLYCNRVAGHYAVGGRAFAFCTSLTSITIPEGVTSIGNDAFGGCSSLTSINIPDGVTSIGVQAFYLCTSLTSITFMGAAPTVATDAFLGVADGAVALVTIEVLSSFGGLCANWNSLTVSMSDSYLNDLSAQVAELSQRPTQASYDAVVVERNARPTQVAYDAAVATARTDGQGDVSSDPASYSLVTQASYDVVVAERDARFTEDQIHAMSADYTMGLNEAGNVQIKIFFIESADLQTFAPFTVTPESVSVVDGSICLEFARADDAAFFRFSVQ